MQDHRRHQLLQGRLDASRRRLVARDLGTFRLKVPSRRSPVARDQGTFCPLVAGMCRLIAWHQAPLWRLGARH